MAKGLKVKVAIDDNGEPFGFAHCLPIELGTWGTIKFIISSLRSRPKP